MGLYALVLVLALVPEVFTAPCSDERDCTLSGSCLDGKCVCDKPWTGEQCETLKLKPAKMVAPFQPVRGPNHFTWGCAPFLAGDGRVCFYFTWLTGWADGNHTRPVPVSDRISGSLGLACASSVDGPYEVLEKIAFTFRPGHYDAAYIENAVIIPYPYLDGYLLAYTTSPPSVNRSTVNWEGNGELQYMGLAFTKDLLHGPWERLNHTILQPETGGFEKHIAINPAVLAFENGSLSVTYRGTHDDGFGNCFMKSWREPCVRPVHNLFNNDPRWVKTEDAFTYKGPRGYIMIAHSFAHPPYTSTGAGAKAFSQDGVHWTWGGYNAYSYTMALANGSSVSFYRREEPKLLFDAEGKPLALFNVVDPNFLYNDTHIVVQELDYGDDVQHDDLLKKFVSV